MGAIMCIGVATANANLVITFANDQRRESGLDVREILRLLPHRYPFLLLDRVLEIDGYKRAVAIKNVTINEPFFVGHFPHHPVMPGQHSMTVLPSSSSLGRRLCLWALAFR